MIDLSDLANDLDEAVLPNGTPSPYTPEHREAAASVLGYESAAQRDEVDPPKKRHRRTKAEMEAARAAEAAGKATGSGETAEEDSPASADGPENGLASTGFSEPTPFDGVEAEDVKWDEAPAEATETQVLIDELHFLRDDLRNLASDIRKLQLAVEQRAEGKAAAA